MTAAFIVHPLAALEISVTQQWYDECRFGLGSEFLACVIETFERIHRHPKMYAGVGDGLHRAVLRRFPYQVLYYADDGGIAVLVVAHDHREPLKILAAATGRRRS